MRINKSSPLNRIRASRLYLYLAPALTVVFLAIPGMMQGDFRTDSHVYVAITRSMLDRGDWTHLMMGNVPYLNKPPMSFWIVAPLVAALGPSLLAVRLAMTIIAALCAGCVFGMCRELASARVALTAGLVFALTHEVFRYTHAFSMDLPLTLFIVLCAWAIIHSAGIRRCRPRSGWWIVLAGLPMGLALLTKPLLGLLILLPLCVWLVLVQRGRMLIWIPGLLLVGAGVALPWHIEMISDYPAGSATPFVDTYFLAQAFDRLSSDSPHVSEPAWYYLKELGLTYLPWVLFLLGGVVWIVVRRRPVTRRWPADLLALLWALLWIGAMSISAGKSMRYIVPVYPALALLVGGVLVRMPPRGRITPIVLPWIVGAGALMLSVLGVRIHAPAPESRAAIFAFLDAYARGDGSGWPEIWIAPDQLRTSAYFTIERGVSPKVALSPETPTGGRPRIGDLMLYRVGGRYVPRASDSVLTEEGVWIVTRIGSEWTDRYRQR